MLHGWPARIRGAAALGGLIALCSADCGTDVSSSGSLEAVLGIGSLCMSRLQQIHMQVTSDGTVVLVHDYFIRSLSDLPLAVTLPSSGSVTGVNTVDLTFYIRPKPGQKRGEQLPLRYQYASGSTGRVVLALSCVCLGVSCPAGEYCEERPAGTGRASCQPVGTCGDGICTAVELGNCPEDCLASCGNGTCDADETCITCPVDCACEPPASCGNGTCDAEETCSNCPSDCCCFDACCKNQASTCCVSGCADGSGGAGSESGSSGVGASGVGASESSGVGATGFGASDSVGVGASGIGASDSTGVGATGAGASDSSGVGASDSSGVGASDSSGVGASDSSGAGASDSSGAGAGFAVHRVGPPASKRPIRRRGAPRHPSLEGRSNDSVSR